MGVGFEDEPVSAVIEFERMTDDEMDEIFYTDDEIGDMRYIAFMISVGLEEEDWTTPDVEPVAWPKSIDQQHIQNFESNLTRLKAERKQQMAEMTEIGTRFSNFEPEYIWMEDDWGDDDDDDGNDEEEEEEMEEMEEMELEEEEEELEAAEELEEEEVEESTTTTTSPSITKMSPVKEEEPNYNYNTSMEEVEEEEEDVVIEEEELPQEPSPRPAPEPKVEPPNKKSKVDDDDETQRLRRSSDDDETQRLRRSFDEDDQHMAASAAASATNNNRILGTSHRQQQIEKEIDQYCIRVGEQLDDYMRLEGVKALKIAANKMAYKKKFQGRLVAKICDLLAGYDIYEEAEQYYYDEQDEYPLKYISALRELSMNDGGEIIDGEEVKGDDCDSDDELFDIPPPPTPSTFDDDNNNNNDNHNNDPKEQDNSTTKVAPIAEEEEETTPITQEEEQTTEIMETTTTPEEEEEKEQEQVIQPPSSVDKEDEVPPPAAVVVPPSTSSPKKKKKVSSSNTTTTKNTTTLPKKAMTATFKPEKKVDRNATAWNKSKKDEDQSEAIWWMDAEKSKRERVVFPIANNKEQEETQQQQEEEELPPVNEEPESKSYVPTPELTPSAPKEEEDQTDEVWFINAEKSRRERVIFPSANKKKKKKDVEEKEKEQEEQQQQQETIEEEEEQQDESVDDSLPPPEKNEEEEPPAAAPEPEPTPPPKKEEEEDPTAEIWWMNAEKSVRERVIFPTSGNNNNKKAAAEDSSSLLLLQPVNEEPAAAPEPKKNYVPTPELQPSSAPSKEEDDQTEEVWFINAEKSRRERIIFPSANKKKKKNKAVEEMGQEETIEEEELQQQQQQEESSLHSQYTTKEESLHSQYTKESSLHSQKTKEESLHSLAMSEESLHSLHSLPPVINEQSLSSLLQPVNEESLASLPGVTMNNESSVFSLPVTEVEPATTPTKPVPKPRVVLPPLQKQQQQQQHQQENNNTENKDDEDQTDAMWFINAEKSVRERIVFPSPKKAAEEKRKKKAAAEEEEEQQQAKKKDSLLLQAVNEEPAPAPAKKPKPVPTPKLAPAPAPPAEEEDQTDAMWFINAEKSRRERIVFPSPKRAAEEKEKKKAAAEEQEGVTPPTETIVEEEEETTMPESEPMAEHPVAVAAATEPEATLPYHDDDNAETEYTMALKDEPEDDIWAVNPPEKSIHRDHLKIFQVRSEEDDSMHGSDHGGYRRRPSSGSAFMISESEDESLDDDEPLVMVHHKASTSSLLPAEDESLDDDEPMFLDEPSETREAETKDETDKTEDEAKKDPTAEIWWMDAEKTVRKKIVFPYAGKPESKKEEEGAKEEVVVEEEEEPDSPSNREPKKQIKRNSLLVDLGEAPMSVAEFSENSAVEENPEPAVPETKPAPEPSIPPPQQVKANGSNRSFIEEYLKKQAASSTNSSRTESTASMNDSLTTPSVASLLRPISPQPARTIAPLLRANKKAVPEEEKSPIMSPIRSIKSASSMLALMKSRQAERNSADDDEGKQNSLFTALVTPVRHGKKARPKAGDSHPRALSASVHVEDKKARRPSLKKTHSATDLEKMRVNAPPANPAPMIGMERKLMRTNSGNLNRVRRRPRRKGKKRADDNSEETLKKPQRRVIKVGAVNSQPAPKSTKRMKKVGPHSASDDLDSSPKHNQVKKGSLESASDHITTKSKRVSKKGALESASDHITTKSKRVSKKGALESASDHITTKTSKRVSKKGGLEAASDHTAEIGSPNNKSPKRASRRMKKGETENENATTNPKSTKRRSTSKSRKRSSSVGKKKKSNASGNKPRRKLKNRESLSPKPDEEEMSKLDDSMNQLETKDDSTNNENSTRSMNHLSLDLSKDGSNREGSARLNNSRELPYTPNDSSSAVRSNEDDFEEPSKLEVSMSDRNTGVSKDDDNNDEPSTRDKNADPPGENKPKLQSSWGDMTADLEDLGHPSTLNIDPSKLENSVIEIDADSDYSNSNSNDDDPDLFVPRIVKSKSDKKMSFFSTPKKYTKRLSKSLTNVLKSPTIAIKSGLDSSFHKDNKKKKNKGGKNQPTFDFNYLPIDVKQKVAFFLPAGDVMNLVATSKSMRSDLNFDVVSTPLTDAASQNKTYRTGLRTKCIGVVVPNQEASLHSMRFTCDVKVGPKPFGRVWIAEQDVPDNHNPKDLEKLPFHVNKVVARSPSLEADIEVIDVAFYIRPKKMYQIFVRCRMEVEMNNMMLHRVGFPAEETDFVSYQFDALLKS